MCLVRSCDPPRTSPPPVLPVHGPAVTGWGGFQTKEQADVSLLLNIFTRTQEDTQRKNSFGFMQQLMEIQNKQNIY